MLSESNFSYSKFSNSFKKLKQIKKFLIKNPKKPLIIFYKKILNNFKKVQLLAKKIYMF